MSKNHCVMSVPGSPGLFDETLIPIAEACKQLPVPVSRSKIERMWRTGVRGVHLETVLIGDRRFTSKEAIRRFLENSQGSQNKHPSEALIKPKRRVMTDEEVEAARDKYNFPPSGFHEGREN